MGKVLGRERRIKIEGALLDCELTNDLSIQWDEIDTTCKDDGVAKTFVLDGYQAELTFEQNVETSGTNNEDDMMDVVLGGTSVSFELSTFYPGAVKYSGSGIIKQAQLSNPKDGLATINYTMKVVGLVTKGSVPE